MKFGLREVVFITMLMLIPVGAWWFVFRPQNAKNAEMRAEIELRQAKLQELNKAMSTIGNLKGEIEQLRQAITYFQSKLPNEKEIDKILQDIWRLAESNELRAESIRTLPRSTSKTTYLPAGATQGEQPIAVNLTGDFRGFYSFLLALENKARIMRIHKMNIEIENDAPAGFIKADFEMSIFFEQDSEDKPWPQKTRT